MRNFLSILVILLISISSYGSHLAGAEIIYKCVGNNQYEVTLKIVRDCLGAPVLNSYMLDAKDPNCGSARRFQVTLQSTQKIDLFCSSLQTTCEDSTSIYAGYEEYVYTGTTNIPNCPNVVFSYRGCCRNSAISNLSPGRSNLMYIEAMVDNWNSPLCTELPDVTGPLIVYACPNTSFTYTPIINSTDSLRFMITETRSDVNVWNSYLLPSSIFNPFGTVNFNCDSITGVLTGITGNIGFYVFTMKIEQYRSGILIGYYYRDIQVAVFGTQYCNGNSKPILSTLNQDISICLDDTITGEVRGYDLDSDSLIFEIIQLPQGMNIIIDSSIPDSPILLYEWNPTGGTGNHKLIIKINDNACPLPLSSFLTINIFVSYIEPREFTIYDVYCYGDSNGAAYMDVTGDINLSYLWLLDSIDDDHIIDLHPGEYIVQTTDGICLNLDTVTISEPDSIRTWIIGDTCVNEGDTVALDVLSSDSIVVINWMPTDSILDSTTIFYVEVINHLGCISTDSIIVKVIPLPIDTPVIDTPPVGSEDPLPYPGDTIVIPIPIDTSPSIDTFVILPNDTIYTDTPIIIPPVPEEKDNVIFIPNMFSPNSDGINDIFYIYGDNIYQIRISVYNRWGEMLFETTDQSIGWDGYYKGARVMQGVYVYYVRGFFTDGEKIHKSGSVTVIN